MLEENRFIAARDGMDARLLDPVREALVPARLQLDQILEACLPHARDLGCQDELATVRALADNTGAGRQLELGRGDERLPELVGALADLFTSHAAPGPEAELEVAHVDGRRGTPCPAAGEERSPTVDRASTGACHLPVGSGFEIFIWMYMSRA